MIRRYYESTNIVEDIEDLYNKKKDIQDTFEINSYSAGIGDSENYKDVAEYEMSGEYTFTVSVRNSLLAELEDYISETIEEFAKEETEIVSKLEEAEIEDYDIEATYEILQDKGDYSEVQVTVEVEVN